MANKYLKKKKRNFATYSLLNDTSVLFLSFPFFFVKDFGVEHLVFGICLIFLLMSYCFREAGFFSWETKTTVKLQACIGLRRSARSHVHASSVHQRLVSQHFSWQTISWRLGNSQARVCEEHLR